MADGSHIEVAKAYVTIVPSMEGSQQTIAQELGASASEASKEVGEQAGKDFGNALATGLKATAATIATAVAAVTAAAVATGKAFIDAANDVAEWGNTVDKESQKMNMSAAGYQEWSFILEHAGTSIDGMKTAMKKLTVAAEEGDDAFAALGITQEQLAAMSPEETWNATVAALQNVSDEGERTYLASQLLGKGAVELAPLFNMTAEETDALKQQVYDLGGIMSDDAVKAAAEYEDQLQNMKTSLTGLKNNIMSQFLPGISSVMEGLSLLFSGNGGMEQIQAGLMDITSQIAELSPQFVELAGAIIMSLLDAFGPQLPTLLTGIFGFLNQALVGVVQLIPSLMPVVTLAIQGLIQTVFQCLPLITSSLITLITDLVTWLASGNNAKTFMSGIVQLVTQIVSQISMVLPIILPAIAQIISALVIELTSPDNIQLLINAVLLVAGATFMALVNTVPTLISFVQDVLQNLGGILANFFGFAVPLVAQGIAGIVTTVQGWGANIKGYIDGLINSIRDGINNWLANLQNSFINGFNTILGWVWSIVSTIQGFVYDCINTLASLPWDVYNLGVDIYNNFVSILSGLPGAIIGLFTDMANGVVDAINWLPDKFNEIAGNIINGLTNGLDVSKVTNKISQMGSSIETAIKQKLGISSPSKVFKEIGEYTAEGFGIGFENEFGDVRDDMVDSVGNLTTSMTAEVSAYSPVGIPAGDTTTYNGGGITVNVYGAEGQDVNSLAEVIAEKLEDMTARKGAVYA